MVTYLIGLFTGAFLGFFGTKLFEGRGLGIVSNTTVGAVGGVLGVWYLADFLHSLENIILIYGISASIGAIISLFVIMFCFNFDED